MPAAPALSPSSCPHCQQPLGALAQRLKQTHCGSATCRQRADQEVLQGRWQQVVALATEYAVQQGLGPTSTPPAVVWLDPAPRQLTPVTDALREQLAQAWRQAWAEDRRRGYRGADTAQALPAAATALCAQCGGTCCVQGALHHAFVDAETLERWLLEHPGQTSEDAIAAYLAALPEQHLDGGCAFQTATGCHLPREQRADICNRYVCPALDELGDTLRATPDRAALVFTRQRRRFERAAVLHQGRATPLNQLPQPDELQPPGPPPQAR